MLKHNHFTNIAGTVHVRECSLAGEGDGCFRSIEAGAFRRHTMGIPLESWHTSDWLVDLFFTCLIAAEVGGARSRFFGGLLSESPLFEAASLNLRCFSGDDFAELLPESEPLPDFEEPEELDPESLQHKNNQ